MWKIFFRCSGMGSGLDGSKLLQRRAASHLMGNQENQMDPIIPMSFSSGALSNSVTSIQASWGYANHAPAAGSERE